MQVSHICIKVTTTPTTTMTHLWAFMRHITRHLCTMGLIAISTIRAMNRPGIAPGGASKKGDNSGSVILLVRVQIIANRRTGPGNRP
jgi:hypothetical protein